MTQECYFGTITGIGSPRYCCQQNGFPPCGGVTGGSQNFVSGSPRSFCNCDASTLGGSFNVIYSLPFNYENKMYGFMSFTVTGPGIVESFPDSPGNEVELYGVQKASPRVLCAAYNSSDTGNATLVVTKKGNFRTITLPAGDFVITARTKATGIPVTGTAKPEAIKIRFCSGTSCPTQVCGGTCDLTTEWCAQELTCTSGNCGGRPNLYFCCPIGKNENDASCRENSATMKQISLLILAIVAFFVYF
jgi:hypothetical protein